MFATLTLTWIGMKVRVNHIRQGPQYTIAALQEGVYVIGMKD